ncbi:DnaJ-domain-containing protein [Linderina pennispora]|uniref:DnaJ-domain-containing protein n=1 Tax=Linderina pennispora TaxID=61395 RepID=A0A1Y1WJT1_9FUNG|nr:DnaJ-domain-containing protein [Linderina pennispora]ORX73364.1 DnaJ-domain-containing protein [Linderina pennispora]
MTGTNSLPFDLPEGEDVPDLYEVLNTHREATSDDLRRAYRKRALQTHPDKWTHLDPDSAEAKAKTIEFQKVGFAYTILKDTKRRQIYDRTGSVENLDTLEAGKDWDAYFRELWSGIVDATTIAQFAKTYKGSDEERQDIISAYNLHSGDLDLIFTEVMLAEIEDEQRFVEVIEKAIKDKELKRTKAFTKSKKGSKERKRKAEAEAAEANALRKELGLDDQLRKALIRQRSSNRMDSIIANIEEKYIQQASKKGKKNGKASKKQKTAKPTFSEPSEEEFQALQAKLFGKK